MKFLRIAILCLLCLSARGADITPGYSFTDDEELTAAKLATLASGTINASFYSTKSALATPVTADYFLLYSTAAGGLRRVTLANGFFDHASLLSGRTLDSSPATNDYVLTYDVSAAAYRKATIGSLLTNSALLNDLVETTNPSLGGFTLWSDAGAEHTKVRRTNLLNSWWTWLPALTNLTATTAPDPTNLVWIYDQTANANKATPLQSILQGGVVGAASGLIVQNDPGSPTNRTKITADDINLKNSTGLSYTASSVNVTNNFLTSGANGIDSGSVAVSTWYYLYVISDRTNVASLLSTSATTPTLPGSYSYKALVSAVYNSDLNTNTPFYQVDRSVSLNETVVLNSVNGYAAAVFTNLYSGSSGSNAFVACVPPIARRVRGTFGTVAGTDGISLAADTNGLARVNLNSGSSAGTVDSFRLCSPFTLPLKTYMLYWQPKDNTAANNRIVLSGFDL